MDYRAAEFVRFIDPTEELKDVIEEAKADTWVKEREHALLSLADGRLALVRGGRDGIVLEQLDDGSVVVRIAGLPIRIRKLSWHTHVEPTGPSDHDRRLLDLLGQKASIVFEIRGEIDGTIYTGMTSRRHDGRSGD